MNPIALKIFSQLFLGSLPTLVVCLVACVIILSRGKTGSSWSIWALCGFGLGLLIALAIPITQAFVQSWLAQSGNVAAYAWVFTVLGLFWSVLHACVYALLFVAIFEGRK